MNRLLTAGAVLLLCGLLVFAVLGIKSCAEQPDVATTVIEPARNEGLAGAATDAAAITSNVMTEASDIDATTRENERVIRSTPGADAPVPAAVNTAGVRALCLRAAYRDQPRCVALLGPRAGAAGR